MDAGRLSQGQMIAAASAVVLLVAMFLPWIGAEGVDDENIWKLSSLDVYLLIVVTIALLAALLAFSGGAEEFSFFSAATFLLGFVGIVLVIVWLTIDFPDGAERKFGAYIGLAACVGVAYGGFKAMQEAVAEEL